MKLMIVTGMSGAGKRSVMKILEDMDFFCVDNLPIELIPKLTQLVTNESESIDKAALGIDIRSRSSMESLGQTLAELDRTGFHYEVLFLDASTETLVKRYKETRRNHPLVKEGRVDKAIEAEREKLAPVKKIAEYILDTSTLLIRELKQEIEKIVNQDGIYQNFFVTVVSFGFKHGIPVDCDLVFDVRFLPNPFYIPELKPKTGNDAPVYEYVMEAEAAKVFLDKLEDMIRFLIPNYIIEGKNQLVIGIGCTGGKHRSVTIANALSKRVEDMEYSLKVEHRDIQA